MTCEGSHSNKYLILPVFWVHFSWSYGIEQRGGTKNAMTSPKLPDWNIQSCRVESLPKVSSMRLTIACTVIAIARKDEAVAACRGLNQNFH